MSSHCVGLAAVVVTEIGPPPAGKKPTGGTGLKVPVFGSIWNADTLVDPLFATYRNLPDGSTVTDSGLVPVANRPTCVSAPLELLTAYTSTSPGAVPPLTYTRYRKLPAGSTAAEKEPPPVAKGPN